MELTRTKHWERIWSCVQSLMGPGVLIGTGVTSYLGKSGFYACATCVLLGAGIIGMELIDLSKCGSPQLSSVDNESPIPPAPPPILPSKYGQTLIPHQNPGFYPLRRSVSLQQPIYPYGPDPTTGNYTHNQGYSPFCADCNPPQYPTMVRSLSLPQAHFRNTGTQTNPNSPERTPGGGGDGFERQPRQTGRLAQKNSVMFASNPQLFPQQHSHSHHPSQHHQQQIHIPLQHNQQQQQSRSNRSSSERFPDIPIEPQFTSAGSLTSQQQEPAFTRHYFDSSQMVPLQKKNEDQKLKQVQAQAQAQQTAEQQQQQQRQIHAQQQQQHQQLSNSGIAPQRQQDRISSYTQNPIPFVSNQKQPMPFNAQNQPQMSGTMQNQQPLSVQNHHQIPFAPAAMAIHPHSALKNHQSRSSSHHQQQQQQQQQQQSNEPVRERQQGRQQTRAMLRHQESHEQNHYMPSSREKNSQQHKSHEQQQQSYAQNQHQHQQQRSFAQNQQQQQQTSRQPIPFMINQQKSGGLNPQQQSFLENQQYYFSQNQPFVINAQQQHSYPQSYQLPTLQQHHQAYLQQQNLNQYLPASQIRQNQSQVHFEPQFQSSRNGFGTNQQMFMEQNAFHQSQQYQRQPPPDSYFYNNSLHLNQQSKKLSSAEFEVDEPRFHSLRRPIPQGQTRSCFVTDGSASNASLSWQDSTESKYLA